MKQFTTYKLTIEHGPVFYAGYAGGLLHLLQMPEKEMLEVEFSAFLREIPQREIALCDFTAFKGASKYWPVLVKEVAEPRTIKDKAILWHMAYSHYRKVSYKATDMELANIKNVPMTKSLLKTFFETPNLTNFTLDNYRQRINITRDYMVNGYPDQRFPDDFQMDYYRSLDDAHRMAYERHLRERGFERVTTGSGVAIWRLKEEAVLSIR